MANLKVTSEYNAKKKFVTITVIDESGKHRRRKISFKDKADWKSGIIDSLLNVYKRPYPKDVQDNVELNAENKVLVDQLNAGIETKLQEALDVIPSETRGEAFNQGDFAV